MKYNYEIKSQFYQNFRKESIPYWSQIWTKKGKITTKKINRGGKNNQLLEDWKDNIESGTILTPNSIYGENGKPNVVKATLPFYGCMIIALLLVSFIPDISLIIPKIIGGYVPAV